MAGALARMSIVSVASGLDAYAVPAFITDSLNRIVFTNREFARIVGNPVRAQIPLDQRFVASLMAGPYRDCFPRYEEEITACLPGLYAEVECGNLSQLALTLADTVLATHPRLRKLVGSGDRSWDGRVVLRGRDGVTRTVRETVIPLSHGAARGYHVSQWLPDERASGPGLVTRLTARQTVIARLYATGLTSREVAERASITVRTARDHLEEIYDRLDIHSRAALAGLLVREDLSMDEWRPQEP